MQAGAMSALGQAATVAQLAGVDVGGLISMIVEVVQTVQRNKKECRQLMRHVMMIDNLLQLLQQSEIMQRPEITIPLDGLVDTLLQAYKLVTSCQQSNIVYRLFMAANQAQKFRDVRDEIDSYLRIYPMISHIDTRYFLRTLHSHAHPSGTLPQTEEDSAGVITVATTGTGTPFAPSSSNISSSGLTEFSLSDTVATHHVSEEINIRRGQDCSIMQEIVIKVVGMTSQKCRWKALKVAAAEAGVNSVTVGGPEADWILVVGYRVDSVNLTNALRMKVAPADLVYLNWGKQEEDSGMYTTLLRAMDAYSQHNPANNPTGSRLVRAARPPARLPQPHLLGADDD